MEAKRSRALLKNLQRPTLQNLPDLPLRAILLELTLLDKQRLGSVSRLLRQRILALDKVTFKVWRLDSVTHRDLEQFSEDVCVVHQLELGLLAGTAAEVNDAVRRLVCRHPELRSLGRLQQSGTIKLGDAGLRCLLTLACLSKLDLTGSEITGEEVSSSASRSISSLSLSNCTNLTDKGLHNLLTVTCGALSTLDLSRTSVTGEGIGSFLSGLERISLAKCPLVTDIGVMEVLAACGPTLKSINVRGTEFTGKGVSKLPKFPCLETLKAGGCKNFTDAGLSEILPSCAQTLVSLDINTTGVALEAANLPPLPNIQNVSLGRTGITEKSLDSFVLVCGAGLRVLDILGTGLDRPVRVGLEKLWPRNHRKCVEPCSACAFSSSLFKFEEICKP